MRPECDGAASRSQSEDLNRAYEDATMRWYEFAKILHFIGLVALFGFFMINQRAGMQLRAATQLADVRTWLGMLQTSRGLLHGGSGLLLISGIVMIAFRWRGPFPFASIGMFTLLLIWILSAVGGRHLRSIRTAIPSANGSISAGLREIILAPWPWAITAAMNGAAAGVLFVMTWKPGWIGAAATVLLASAVGASIGIASIRRQRATVSVGRLSTAA
jgi:hypothetical protein